MKIDFSGKTALITGSTAGIGLAAARGLARAGAKVAINGRTQARVDEALAGLQRDVPGVRAQGVAADVGTAAGCEALVHAVPEVDVLVNNAGVFGARDFFDVTDADWTRFYEVNVLAGVRLSRAYLPGMQERGWGRVIFISSESGLNLPVEMIHYGVTKTALLGLSRGLAKRMAATGVTVNAVLPGPTLTEGVARMLEGDMRRTGQSLEEAAAELVRVQRSSSIIRRAMTPAEVAHMIVYVASPQASATTGAALRVDGGIVDSIA